MRELRIKNEKLRIKNLIALKFDRSANLITS